VLIAEILPVGDDSLPRRRTAAGAAPPCETSIFS
jgi:hypothetical protein